MARASSKSIHTIHVALRKYGWKRTLPDVETFAKKVAQVALAGVKKPVEVSIVLSNDYEVQRLNREWRHQNKPTNVLSFPSGETKARAGEPLLIGDVILAYETARQEVARGDSPSLRDHLAHLLVHGILHLLGHDHEDDDEAEEMEGLEASLLSKIGVADPYAVAKHR